MTRQWRIEFEGAYYHILSRGNERRNIFTDDNDRILFLEILGKMSERFEIEVYAYELLSRIAYLHPALDIPYCHHEKWDGTGYPRGLKGEEIPVAARIFAVVDVWDAMRSDHPYRKGWAEEKVREYIKSLAGTHFDPKVVEVFLKEKW